MIYDWKGQNSKHLTEKIIKIAKKKRWNIVGTVAYGNNKHTEILNVLNESKGDYPKFIRLFYLDSDDFYDIKSEFKRVGNEHIA